VSLYEAGELSCARVLGLRGVLGEMGIDAYERAESDEARLDVISASFRARSASHPLGRTEPGRL
jgi:hypothetical protein